MPQNSREMIFLFFVKTQWQMFLLLYGRHVGAPLGRAPTWLLHTKFYNFLWNCLPNNAAMSNRIDLNLDDVFSLSIIYHIPDSWINLLNGCDFYFPCKPPIENTIRKRVFRTILECSQKYGVICNSLIHWRLRCLHLLYDIEVIWRKTIKHAFYMFYFSNFYMFTGAINLMGCWENTSVNNC